jgi:aspartyl-tRNA(Asn)/glutamyl-tRNA(Gln) amidotransferase subunit B
MINSGDSPEDIAKNNNWIQDSNTDSLSEFVKQAIAKYPEKVKEYKSGKKGLIGLFMGEVMKLSLGKADPKLANQLVKKELEK